MEPVAVHSYYIPILSLHTMSDLLTTLPPDILLYNLLPVLPTADLLRLACTNKACAYLFPYLSAAQEIRHLPDYATTKPSGARNCSMISILQALGQPGPAAGNSYTKALTSLRVLPLAVCISETDPCFISSLRLGVSEPVLATAMLLTNGQT